MSMDPHYLAMGIPVPDRRDEPSYLFSQQVIEDNKNPALRAHIDNALREMGVDPDDPADVADLVEATRGNSRETTGTCTHCGHKEHRDEPCNHPRRGPWLCACGVLPLI